MSMKLLCEWKVKLGNPVATIDTFLSERVNSDRQNALNIQALIVLSIITFELMLDGHGKFQRSPNKMNKNVWMKEIHL